MKNIRLRLFLGFIIALLLSIVPIPEVLCAFRPPWALLFVLYIEYFLPAHFSITALVFIGLLLDVLMATVMGQHPFALVLISWIASSKIRRFRFFSMMQQIFLIGSFCFVYQATISFISVLMGFNYSLVGIVLSSLVAMFAWPLICLLGEDLLFIRIAYLSQPLP